MSTKKLVIFDFDGVLVESLDLWFRITQEHNPDLTIEEYHAMSYGNYIEALEAKKLIYTDTGLDTYRREVLAIEIPKPILIFIRSNQSRYIFAIVSSGSEATIKSFLRKEGIEEYFSLILGNESHKSKTVKLKDVLKTHDVVPGNAVFVTDTLGDILEAHAASIKSIGVLWGLHDRETLERGKPESIIDNPSELEEAVGRVLNG